MIPLKMIDESSYQSHQWTASALKASRIQVVMVKATEGTGYTSPDYGWQVGQARQAGCVVGHYHLIHAETNTAAAEIAYLRNAVSKQARPGDLISYDVEPQFIQKISAGAGSAWIGAFSKALHSAFGASPICYTANSTIGGGWLESVRGRDPLWLAWPGANPSSPPAPARPWVVSFLQYGLIKGTDADSAFFSSPAGLAKLGIPPLPVLASAYTSDGTQALGDFAAKYGTDVAGILQLTARNRSFGSTARAYIDAGVWTDVMPTGMVVWHP